MSANTTYYPPTEPTSKYDFQVVILCALPLEVDAVEALFDQFWDEDNDNPLFDQAPGDTNTYTVGAIGRHNVVLAQMPGMGTKNAATVAANCKRSFPNIRLGLVVGICGVVPRLENVDMWLGDVIISTGVVQVDFGRLTIDGFQRKDTLEDNLPRPPPEIIAFLKSLQTVRAKQSVSKHVSEYMDVLRRNSLLQAEYPGGMHDRLFEAECEHTNDKLSCEGLGCNEKFIARHRTLSGQDGPLPSIRVGKFASGSGVMKSGKERELIAGKDGIIAFEMEGAGAWENFPCVVIKGACDYADSHKHKLWQKYAAATAASCMKAFLQRWKPIKTEELSFGRALPINSNKDDLNTCVKELSPLASSDVYHDIQQFDSTKWLFDDLNFKNWTTIRSMSDKTPKLLTIQGNPFTGKSTLMKAAVQRHQNDPNIITLYHFFGSEPLMQNPISACLRQLLSQLLQQVRHKPWDKIRSWSKDMSSDKDTGLWSKELLQKAITEIIAENKAKFTLENRGIRIFIDAINQCSTTQSDSHAVTKHTEESTPLALLKLLSNLTQSVLKLGVDIGICVSRQFVPMYGRNEPPSSFVDLRKHVKAAVEAFVKTELRKLDNYGTEVRLFHILSQSWSDDFRWATVVTEEILSRADLPKLAERIADFAPQVPASHGELYEKALSTLTKSQTSQSEVLQLFELSLGAYRPLTADEFRHALAFTIEDFDYNTMKEWELSGEGLPPDTFEKHVKHESTGFLEVTTYDKLSMSTLMAQEIGEELSDAPHVAFIHHSVQRYLESEKGLCLLHDNSKDRFDKHCHFQLFNICKNVLDYCSLGGDDDVHMLNYACEFWLRHGKQCGDLVAEIELPDFMHSCENSKTQSFVALQIELLQNSPAKEGALLQQGDNLMVLLSTIGCTELLKRHLDICKLCRELTASIEDSEEITKIKMTALLNSIRCESQDTAKYLLQMAPPTDINVLFKGNTLLQMACYFSTEDLHCVKRLLSIGADRCKSSRSMYEYPLHLAIGLGNEQLIEELLRLPVDDPRLQSLFETKRTRGGASALHYAVQSRQDSRKRLAVVRLLLKLAPKSPSLLDLVDDDGFTPEALAEKVGGRDGRQLKNAFESFKLDC